MQEHKAKSKKDLLKKKSEFEDLANAKLATLHYGYAMPLPYRVVLRIHCVGHIHYTRLCIVSCCTKIKCSRFIMYILLCLLHEIREDVYFSTIFSPLGYLRFRELKGLIYSFDRECHCVA